MSNAPTPTALAKTSARARDIQCFAVTDREAWLHPNTLRGMQFGRLTALRQEPGPAGKYGFLWLCVCFCGNETVKARDRLIDGNVVSCGCGHKRTSKRGLNHTPSARIDVEKYLAERDRAASNDTESSQ